MICWFCHWGWPKLIADVYSKALAKLGGDAAPLRFGPAHVVWDDENFDLAQSCLDDFESNKGSFSDSDLRVVRRSLVELLLVDDKYKEWPADYDGEHPEKFPPPADWEMVKV